MFFSRHILAFTILPLLVFSITFSYIRFIQEKDYLVGYDATCDPLSHSCYVRCEDDECLEPEYFAFAERYASRLHTLCGDDISQCEAANACGSTEEGCSITFCDEETETCDQVMPETELPFEGSAEIETPENDPEELPQ